MLGPNKEDNLFNLTVSLLIAIVLAVSIAIFTGNGSLLAGYALLIFYFLTYLMIFTFLTVSFFFWVMCVFVPREWIEEGLNKGD